MKFKEGICGNCGLDLTTATPVRVRDVDEEIVIGNCPNCQQPHFLEPEPEPPTARGGRRRASEPVAVAEPEPEPTPPEPEV